MIEAEKLIERRRLTQTAAAKLFGVSQPRVSDLHRGRIDRFSLDALVQLLARAGILSAEEIFEHKYAYTLPLLGWYFGMADFSMDKIRFGYFECMLNMWATAER